MKRIVSALLCFVMLISVLPTNAFAANRTYTLEQSLAEDLKTLGIFKGVSENDFALSRAPTRTEALVMLIRVLGKEKEALGKGGKHPFTDVPAWADKYVGYAYEAKLTNGVSATKFGESLTASASMYLTFVLRALGYSDENGEDFTWDNPFTLARTCGILRGSPDTINFMRGDVVLVSYAALEAAIKGSEQTLAEKLIVAGVFTAAEYEKNYDLLAFENTGKTVELTAEQISQKCSPAVFYVEVYDSANRAVGSGSGFFIDSDGTAVTNYHVIEGKYSAKIKCSDTGKVYKVAGVYDYSEKNDWAIIKIEGKDFPYLEVNYEKPATGSTIYAIGSPLGLENTLSQGLVSNASRVFANGEFIQISAPISNGSSGGALLDKYGRVIGITSAGIDEGQNLNLARPISVIKGYSKERAYPIRAVWQEAQSLPLGNADFGGMSENEKAFEALRMWITNYSNDILYDSYPAYSASYEENGRESYCAAAYIDDDDMIEIYYAFLADDQLFVTWVDIPRKRDNIEMAYAFYEEYSDEKPVAVGTTTLSRSQIEKNMYIGFDDFDSEEDYYYSSEHEEVASSLYMGSLDFLEAIINSELRAYELDGLCSLGFTHYFE